MIFPNVVMRMSVLSTTNDIKQVIAIIGLVGDGGREPQIPGVIEDTYGLASKEWRFLAAALLVVVLCALGGMLVEVVMFSISMSVSVPDLLWDSGA